MNEQSHKHEMGAALRGDFERLRARRGEVAPMPSPPPEPAAVAAPPTPPITVASPVPARRSSWLERLRCRC